MGNLTQALAKFVVQISFDDLPEVVVHEAKRALLDSIGCAIAGIATDKGKTSIKLARRLGGPPESSILGTGDKVSCSNAAFANGELINALDYDTLLTPAGHVSPYVIPAPLALAESVGASGKDLILATVLGHEISARMARALKLIIFSPAYGYSHCILGSALSAGKILKLDYEKMSHALGIAGYFCPIPTFAKWSETPTSAMTKYGSSGWVSTGAVTAALMAEMGYTGDTTIFEGEHGLWRSLTTETWEPNAVMDRIGETWLLLGMEYKPYPCCRHMHGALDCFVSIIDKNNLEAENIESVKAFCFPQVENALWRDNKLATAVDAQFNVPYVFATAAHRIKAVDWQDSDTMRNPKILKFMKKVSYQGHPRHKEEQRKDSRSRISMVEVVANGKVFREERLYHKGTPFTDVRATDDELVEKFKGNVSRILTQHKVDQAVKSLLQLEMVENVSELLRQVTL